MGRKRAGTTATTTTSSSSSSRRILRWVTTAGMTDDGPRGCCSESSVVVGCGQQHSDVDWRMVATGEVVQYNAKTVTTAAACRKPPVINGSVGYCRQRTSARCSGVAAVHWRRLLLVTVLIASLLLNGASAVAASGDLKYLYDGGQSDSSFLVPGARVNNWRFEIPVALFF